MCQVPGHPPTSPLSTFYNFKSIVGWLFLSSIYLSIYLYAISIILKCIVSGIKYIHSRYGGSFTSRVYLPGTGQQLCIISTKTSPFLFVVSAGLSWPSTLIFVLWMSEHPFPTLKVDWPSGCIIFYQKLGGDAQLSSFWCCCWEIWSHSDSWLFVFSVTCFLSLETRRYPHLPVDIIMLGAQVGPFSL